MQVRILLTSNLLTSSALLKRRFPAEGETPFAYLIRSQVHTRDYLQNHVSIFTACKTFGPNLHKRYRFSHFKMQILVTPCARNAPNSHKRCTTDAKQAVHTSFTKHLGSPRCSVVHRRDMKTQKSVTDVLKTVQNDAFWVPP